MKVVLKTILSALFIAGALALLAGSALAAPPLAIEQHQYPFDQAVYDIPAFDKAVLELVCLDCPESDPEADLSDLEAAQIPDDLYEVPPVDEKEPDTPDEPVEPETPLVPDTPDNPLTPDEPVTPPATVATPPATSTKLPNTGTRMLVLAGGALALIGGAAFIGKWAKAREAGS